jgi:hypothetical protein
MIEAFGDIWEHVDEYDAVVITTNGTVKKNGEAVMGRGIALQAKERYPLLPKDLGEMLKKEGNVPFGFSYTWGEFIFTLPVKHHWHERASIKLIERSTITLVEALEKTNNVFHWNLSKIVMPRPGCGNGGLKWEDVKPVIEPYLDDRFTVMERA